MLLSNITEDTFQIIRNQASEIFIFPNLRHFQRPQVQVIFLAAIFHQCHLPDGFQHGVHIVDAHICDSVNVNLSIQHKALEIFMADQLRQQPVVELARFQYINRSITQMQLMQSCVWVIFCFRPSHQIVAGNTVIVSQQQNAVRADVLAVIRFIFAKCGFRDTHLGGKLLQRQLLCCS